MGKFMQNVGLEEKSSGTFLSRKSGWKAQKEAYRWEVCGPRLTPLVEKDPRQLKCWWKSINISFALQTVKLVLPAATFWAPRIHIQVSWDALTWPPYNHIRDVPFVIRLMIPLSINFKSLLLWGLSFTNDSPLTHVLSHPCIFDGQIQFYFSRSHSRLGPPVLL